MFSACHEPILCGVHSAASFCRACVRDLLSEKCGTAITTMKVKFGKIGKKDARMAQELLGRFIGEFLTRFPYRGSWAADGPRLVHDI